LIVQAEANSVTPSELSFRVEAKIVGGPVGDVIQSVEMFNYQTNDFEFVDIRPVSNIDESVVIDATGNVTRFVQAGTGEITVRMIWKSESFVGAPFFWSLDIDEAVWTVTD
jgi:hypothetical protein